MMTVVGLLAAVTLCSSAQPTELVVALDNAPAAEETARAIERSLRQRGIAVLSATEALFRMTGIAEARTPDVAGLRRMLLDARDLDARYDRPTANDMRQKIYEIYTHALWPDADLRSIAAQALHDLAAALWADGKMDAAQDQARRALTEFPEQQVDKHEHSPSMRQRFEAVASAMSEPQRAPIKVTVDRPAAVFADGVAMIANATTANIELSEGPHRIWAADEHGRSYPQLVQLGPAGANIDLSIGTDEHLRFEPAVALQCSDNCRDNMRILAKRLGVDRLVGVRSAAQGLQVATFNVARDIFEQDDMDVLSRPNVPRFSWLYFVPLGIGQWAEHRPGYALGYLGVELGLWAYHFIAYNAHANAVDRHETSSADSLRVQSNVTLILACGTMLVGVVDALAVGYLTGSPSP
jgi:hypothetical protein